VKESGCQLSSRVDPRELSPQTQQAIMALKRALAAEGRFRGVQITFDEVKNIEWPPTVDVRVIYEQT
jgi:hypothetical protein